MRSIPKDPLAEFARWYRFAKAAGVHSLDAIVLATADGRGRPSARLVLYKGQSAEGGFRVFTNYNSRKARDLTSNPSCALIFYWDQLDRQIRVEGKAIRLSSVENDEYWATRPKLSQIGAWASDQSAELPDRRQLLNKVKTFTRRFKGQDVPRPQHWGGYRIVPERIEFWYQKPGRLHRRISFTKSKDAWRGVELNP
jgi:pyridoxamine 5'-phosphate oxidase